MALCPRCTFQTDTPNHYYACKEPRTVRAGLLNNSHTLPDLGRVKEIKHRGYRCFTAVCENGRRSFWDWEEVEVEDDPLRA